MRQGIELEIKDDAAVVAEMLVEADLMGLSSHGVQRIPQYIEDMGA